MDTSVWSIVLLVVALLLVVAELFVPSGGVIGVLSIASALTAIGLAFMTGFQFGMIVLILSCVLIPLLAMFSLRWWPHTPLGRKIVMQPPASEDVLPDRSEERMLHGLIGRRGVARSKMLPSGMVEIDGQPFDAFSDGVPIEVDQPVQVVAVKMRRLQVRLVDPAESAGPARSSNGHDDLLSKPIESFGLEGLNDPLA